MGSYRVIALLDDGGTKLLQVASAHANDWDSFASEADARAYCDALLDKGWRWPGAVALTVEHIQNDVAHQIYIRPI